MSAILADIFVPQNDITPGKVDVLARDPDISDQPDDRRCPENLSHGMESCIQGFLDYSHAFDHKYDGPFESTDMDGFIGIIEDKYAPVHDIKKYPPGTGFSSLQG